MFLVPEQGILLSFPTGKFKTPVVHTRLIKVVSPPGFKGKVNMLVIIAYDSIGASLDNQVIRVTVHAKCLHQIDKLNGVGRYCLDVSSIDGSLAGKKISPLT